jgi:hypothetical protein
MLGLDQAGRRADIALLKQRISVRSLFFDMIGWNGSGLVGSGPFWAVPCRIITCGLPNGLSICPFPVEKRFSYLLIVY